MSETDPIVAPTELADRQAQLTSDLLQRIELLEAKIETQAMEISALAALVWSAKERQERQAEEIRKKAVAPHARPTAPPLAASIASRRLASARR